MRLTAGTWHEHSHIVNQSENGHVWYNYGADYLPTSPQLTSLVHINYNNNQLNFWTEKKSQTYRLYFQFHFGTDRVQGVIQMNSTTEAICWLVSSKVTALKLKCHNANNLISCNSWHNLPAIVERRFSRMPMFDMRSSNLTLVCG